MKIIPTSEIPKRTRHVVFKRQLLPPPPMDARPHWCYINTLVFYDKDNNEVWEQKIPEANWLEYRHGRKNESPFHCSLELDGDYGWTLIIETSHECAYAIWRQVFDKKVHTLNGGVVTKEIGKDKGIPVWKHDPKEGEDSADQ